MSKSYRQQPVVGCAPSEKRDKVRYHRKLRRKVNDLLQAGPETEVYPDANEVTNLRRWKKDPRSWFPEAWALQPKLMRK
jgi:hypothetical protein